MQSACASSERHQVPAQIEFNSYSNVRLGAGLGASFVFRASPLTNDGDVDAASACWREKMVR